MSVRRLMLVCVIVLEPAILSRADAPPAPKNHPARNYAQACARPDYPGLEKSVTITDFEQQMLSLAAPSQPLPLDPEVRRAMCEVALWRLETGAGALPVPQPCPPKSSAIQLAVSAVEGRLDKLEHESHQVHDNLRDNTSAETLHKEPGKIKIVAGIAGLALCLSIVSIFYARWTIRRVLRDAGLR